MVSSIFRPIPVVLSAMVAVPALAGQVFFEDFESYQLTRGFNVNPDGSWGYADELDANGDPIATTYSDPADAANAEYRRLTRQSTWTLQAGADPQHTGSVVPLPRVISNATNTTIYNHGGGGSQALSGGQRYFVSPNVHWAAVQHDVDYGLTGNETLTLEWKYFRTDSSSIGMGTYLFENNKLGVTNYGPGTRFWAFRDAQGNLVQSAQTSPNASRWVEVQMVIDTTAHNGNGGASLSFRQFNADGTVRDDWAAVADLQNVNMHMLDAGASWADLGTVFVNINQNPYAKVSFDDLRISTALVPEPASLALLGLSAFVALRRRA